MVGQTRVHLDEVDGLGYFMTGSRCAAINRCDGQSIADDLMKKLGILRRI